MPNEPLDRDGEVTYELHEFCKEYGNPSGQLFTIEITYNATTYIYADVPGKVCGDRVVFDLNRDQFLTTRTCH